VVLNDLVTTGQLGELVGRSRQWVDRVIRETEDKDWPENDKFPAPEITLPNGARLFKQKPALKWLADHPRRPAGRPPAANKASSATSPKKGGGGGA